MCYVIYKEIVIEYFEIDVNSKTHVLVMLETMNHTIFHCQAISNPSCLAEHYYIILRIYYEYVVSTEIRNQDNKHNYVHV
jgi:hypothetical protein